MNAQEHQVKDRLENPRIVYYHLGETSSEWTPDADSVSRVVK